MGEVKTQYKNIISETVIIDIDEEDIDQYINLLKERIVIQHYPIKLKIIFSCEFKTPVAFDIVEFHYSHPIQIILTENNLIAFYDDLIDKLYAWIDGLQERGSGFVFSKIISTRVKQYKYKNQNASSYIPLQFISKIIINVQNKNDNKCFLWSILSKLYPASKNKQRVSKYEQYENNINMKGIEYPVRIKDILKVEKQNDLCINVFALNNQNNKNSLYPVYISNLKSEIIIDLLYIEDNGNSHYCLIKDLDSFRYNGNTQKTCRNCLQGFVRKETLEKHKELCLNNTQCNSILPKEDNKILKFKNHHFSSKLPVTIYCDFESKNIPLETENPNTEESYTKKIFKQEVISYGIYVKSDYPEIYKSQYFTYTGNDAKEKYVKQIMKIFNKITYNMYLLEKKKPMLTKEEEDKFQETTECYICEKEFKELTSCPKCKEEFLDEDLYCFKCEEQYKEKHKIREHNHLNGEYRGAACQSCNSKEGKNSKIIPVFFHNGSNYDFHFIIEELMKYEDEYNKVTPLAKNSEEYISIDYGTRFKKLRFLDSYRFFTKGLADIAKSLKEFPILESEFEKDIIDEEELELIKKDYLENLKKECYSEYKDKKDKIKKDKYFLLKQKGNYPYEYIDSIEKLNKKRLPKQKKWYSTLSQKGITDEEYEHAQDVWNTYNCETFKDYHDLYLKTDVLLLADAFENFRNFFLKHHKIDPCYCFSAPGLTWQCGLKYTGIELELLTDPDMLLMFEKGIRGGFSGVLGPRHVKAFNKYTIIIDDKEALDCIKKLKEGEELNDLQKEQFLLYLDANNLYGWAMSQKLPTGDFKWEEDLDYYLNIPEGRGCIVECDLKYNNKCKFKTRKFPLAPEHMVATEEMLSEYQLNLLEKQGAKLGKEKKLFLTLYDKKKYIIHHSILKDYIKLGLKVIKVHRIISFKESAWLKPYIDFNTEQRTKSKSLFEKDLWKLMNNSFYGKTMENIRNRSEIKLLSNENEVIKYISKPNFKDSIIFNENLVAIVNNVTSVKFNKPIYLGMCILDYSKQLMYDFYYNTINKLWKDNEIVAMDTDSLFLLINTKDVYKDLEKIQDEMDTSDYPKDHPLYSEENKKVIGKFKDELNGEGMTEIIYLRSKAYAYKRSKIFSEYHKYEKQNNLSEYYKKLEEEKLSECKKLKGISLSTIKTKIEVDDYNNCLYNNEIQLNKMYRLGSEKHKMFVSEINKISLNPFDDKRYIFDDGIYTLPYGINSLYFI